MSAAAPKRFVAALLVLFAAFSQAGCTGPVVTPPPPSSVAPQPASGPACAAPLPAGDSSPAPITGEWVCTGSTTQMRFRFSSDGKYKSREALEYEVPSGRSVFHRDQEGTYTTAGDRLELKPDRSTRTRKMPEDPAGDYADVPEPLERRVFTFRADPDSLHLHETGGHALVLLRAP